MFSNTQYIYDHLPSRYRREDNDQLLRRFLEAAGTTMDEWDGKFDAFFNSIAASTADAEWIEFWLDALFGWSWFPRWFRLANKRTLYGNFARHLARRGTRRGIELWLADFGIIARVHTRSQPWGEFVWGESSFSIPEPLHLIVEILFIKTPPADMCFLGEFVCGESFYSEPKAAFTEKEIVDLVRYQQPHSQEITILWSMVKQPLDDEIYWHKINWPDEFVAMGVTPI